MQDESGIAPDPRIGGLVDARYKILEAMASGSMGIVYKAEPVKTPTVFTTNLSSTVAIWDLTPQGTFNPAARHSFN